VYTYDATSATQSRLAAALHAEQAKDLCGSRL